MIDYIPPDIPPAVVEFAIIYSVNKPTEDYNPERLSLPEFWKKYCQAK